MSEDACTGQSRHGIGAAISSLDDTPTESICSLHHASNAPPAARDVPPIIKSTLAFSPIIQNIIEPQYFKSHNDLTVTPRAGNADCLSCYPARTGDASALQATAFNSRHRDVLSSTDHQPPPCIKPVIETSVSTTQPATASLSPLNAYSAFKTGWSLPPELLRLIICFMDDNAHPPWAEGMFNLLYVCSSWRRQAEGYLYKFIDVPDGNIMEFCRTILSRPDLGRIVRKLRMFGDGRRFPTPEDIDIVSQTLQSMPNLKDLTVLRSSVGGLPLYVLDPEHDHRILLNCPFQLYRFNTDFCWNQDMADFLASQPSLRQIGLDKPSSPDFPRLKRPVPASSLQQWKCLDAPPETLRDFAGVPPISHFRLLISSDHSQTRTAEGAEYTGLLGDTLKVLAIARLGPTSDDVILSPAGIIKRFAHKTPNVIFLGFWDYLDDFDPHDNREIARILSCHFPKLRVFVWAPTRDLEKVSDSSAVEYDTDELECAIESDEEHNSLDKLLSYAQRLFSGNLSLEYFVVGGSRDNWIFMQEKDGSLSRWGPYAPCTFMDNSYQFIDPEDPMEFFCSGGSAVNPDRFGLERQKLGYDQFLRHVDDKSVVPDDYIRHRYEVLRRFVSASNFTQEEKEFYLNRRTDW